MEITKRHAVLVVHGIRTLAPWITRLQNLLRNTDQEIQFDTLYFGYFSTFMLTIPSIRKRMVDRLASSLLQRLKALEGYRIDIVAHSFGTLVVAAAIEKLKRESATFPIKPPIHSLILAGSVLKHDYSWDAFNPTFVGRIVNDCGTRDVPLLLAGFSVIGLGYAGRRGFNGVQCAHFRNRYFEFGHSGFFKKNGALYDDFMLQYWVPVLTRDEPLEEVPDPRARTRYSRLVAWLETYAEPNKLLIHTVVLALPVLTILWLYQEERAARALANANLQAAHSISTAYADGLQALQLALSAASNHDSAEINAALKANVDIAAEPVHWLSHQSVTGVGLAAAHPTTPIFSVTFSANYKHVVSIIDATSGREIESFTGSRDGKDPCRIDASPSNLRFSPKGNYLILESIAGSCLWNTKTHQMVISDLHIRNIEIDANEETAIAVFSEIDRRRPRLFDLKSNPVKAIRDIDVGSIKSIGFAPRGVVISKDNQILLQSIDDSRRIDVIEKSSDQIETMFASPRFNIVIVHTQAGNTIGIDTMAKRVLWKKVAQGDIKRLDFSKDGSKVAVQLGSGESVVWSATDGAEIAKFETSGYPQGIAFVGEGSDLLLTNNRRHDLQIWNLNVHSLWKKIPRDAYQEGAAVSSDGNWIIAGAPHKAVAIWNARNRALNTRSSFRMTSEVSDIGVDNPRKVIVSLGNNGETTSWNTTEQLPRVLRGPTPDDSQILQSIAFDPYGRFAVFQSRSGNISKIDMRSSKEDWRFSLPRLFLHKSQQTSRNGVRSASILLGYSDDVQRMSIHCPEQVPFANRRDGEIDIAKFDVVYRTCSSESVEAIWNRRSISTDAFRGQIRISPSGKFIVVPILDMLVVLDSIDGHEIASLSIGYDSQSEDLFSLSLDNQGFRFHRLSEFSVLGDDSIVAIGEGNVAWLWKWDGKRYNEFARKAFPSSLHFLGLFNNVESGYFFDTKTGDIVVVDLNSLQTRVIDRLPRIVMVVPGGHRNHPVVALVSSEQPELVESGDGPVHVPYLVRLTDQSKGKVLLEVNIDHPVGAIAISSDGKYVAVGELSGMIQIFDVITGALLSRIQRPEGVRKLEFLDNDKYVLSSTAPAHTSPASRYADTVQVDMWRTDDLRRIACTALKGEPNQSRACP